MKFVTTYLKEDNEKICKFLQFALIEGLFLLSHSTVLFFLIFEVIKFE